MRRSSLPRSGALEAAAAGVPVVICISEFIPVLDMVRVKRALQGSGTRLVGPNCPDVYRPGDVGVISRSGTLVYECQ